MAKPFPRRFDAAMDAEPRGVAVSVVVLTKNEEVNIERCLASVAWAEQVVVVDSGSTDRTVELARAAGAAGAEVVETHWRGFGAQREFALRMEILRHDWLFFVDADEWVSHELAAEVAQAVTTNKAAFWCYKRLVFQGRWIEHCGWYRAARFTQLLRRDSASYDDALFSEHPKVSGPVGQLVNDLVDEDLKGLAAWLHKHVRYAELEAERRSSPAIDQPDATVRRRSFLKDVLAPRVPARPVIQFLYMYVLRRGFLDGRAGLSFCVYHAWFQRVVTDLQHEGRGEPGD